MAVLCPKQPDFAAVGGGRFFLHHRVQSGEATQLTEPPLWWIQNRNLQLITHVDIVQRFEVFGGIYLQYLHRLHEVTFSEAQELQFCVVLYRTLELFCYISIQKHLQLTLSPASFNQNNTQESNL